MTTWSQIYKNKRPVGFVRKVGTLEMFSPDGYAWSGKRIDHDRREEETSLRDSRGRRVFHGDIVVMRAAPGADPEEHVILRQEDGTILLGRPDSSYLRPLLDSFPGPKRPVANARLGSVFAEEFYRLRYDAALGALERRGESPWALISVSAISILLGLGITGGFQIWQSGGLEPVITTAGGGAGMALGAYLLQRSQPRALSRARLLAAGPRVGILIGLLFAALYAVAALLRVPGVQHAALEALTGSLAVAILGFMLGYALTLIGGNSVDFYAGRVRKS